MGSERRFHVVGAKPSNGDSCGSTLKDALHREINMPNKYGLMARYCCPKRGDIAGYLDLIESDTCDGGDVCPGICKYRVADAPNALCKKESRQDSPKSEARLVPSHVPARQPHP